MKTRQLPYIEPQFPFSESTEELSQHVDEVKAILGEMLPEGFESWTPQKAVKWLENQLPLVQWDEPTSTPDALSIFFLCVSNQELQAEKVIPELLRKWLIPEKEIYILSFRNFSFSMKEISGHLFFFSETKVLVEDERQLSAINEHLPLLHSELSLALTSSKYFEHLLDTKALSFDQKSTQIQDHLRKLSKRSPEKFDIEIFREMSAFLALSRSEFRKLRLSKHLTRVIVSHYLMRHRILHSRSLEPAKRHLELRCLRSTLQFPFGSKRVLGLSIAIALTDRYESFEDAHIMGAVQRFLKDVSMVKGSYYAYQPHHDPIKYIYLELEKKDGSPINIEEVGLLKRELKDELKRRVEKLIPSVFMIRNEEEVMRNLLLLSQEIKSSKDIPQVIINFDKQTHDELFFTILLVRVVKKGSLTLQEAFGDVNEQFHFIPDRAQNIGELRQKNSKEANVFQLSIPKDSTVVRADFSADFYLAREKVLSLITSALGEVRDYNGGMLLKQGELFSQFKASFESIPNDEKEILESVFFELSPIEAQAVTPLPHLKMLFSLFLDAKGQKLPKRESVVYLSKKKKSTVFVVLGAKDESFKSLLNQALSSTEEYKSLVRTKHMNQGIHYFGFICSSESEALREQFIEALKGVAEKHRKKIEGQQVLRLSFVSLPPSLDPRLGGDEVASLVFKMLFEGLTRIDQTNKPALGLANSVEVSPDGLQYTFQLRTSFWSDGSKVLASDFEYAWKKILSPAFYTPFAFLFFPIKGARDAKEGKIPLDSVGIRTIKKDKLVVDLESPTPEFLEIVSHPIYSPVKRSIDAHQPNWAQSGEDVHVSNGPFKLKSYDTGTRIELVKNPNYWDGSSVKLENILISKSSSEVAFEMYQKGETDWLGKPLRIWEPYFENASQGVKASKLTSVYWCVFNTQRFPFDHRKMREAFNEAIDRRAVVNRLSGVREPAASPLPLIQSQVDPQAQFGGNLKKARSLFEEALAELGLDRKDFPLLTLIHTQGGQRQETMEIIGEVWEEVFGIKCRVEGYEFYKLFDKMVKGDYQVGSISWSSMFNNPSYTLNSFKYRANQVNFSKWEHPKFCSLLDMAQKEVSSDLRLLRFSEAEELLLEEIPVIPLFHEGFQYIHNSNLIDVFCPDSGNIDFKWASISCK